MQPILDALRPAFLMLIEGAGAALVPLLLWKLNEWAKAKVHDARFHCAMDKVRAVAESSVVDVMQTYVKGVRRTGEWSDEAKAEAKTRAMALAKNRLGRAGLKELRGCLGHDDAGIEDVIAGELEQAVRRVKETASRSAA